MLVYRLEKDGRGPYNNDYPGKELTYQKKHDIRDKTRNPGPATDGVWSMYRDWNYDYIFACPSVEELIKWFLLALAPLQEHGFSIVVYCVHGNSVRKSKSGKQVAFNKKKAVKVTEFKLDNVFQTVKIPKQRVNKCSI